jgi:hypothetical protein
MHICAMVMYLENRYKFTKTVSNRDPLFVTASGDALTRNCFLSLLRETFTAAAISYNEYTGHSFRIGAATSAATTLIGDHMIKTLGRWKSDSYCRYIKTPASTIQAAQISLSSSCKQTQHIMD